jgi:hypothetical protein
MNPFTLALLGSSAASIAGGGLGLLGSQRAAGAQQQAAQTSGLYGLIAQQQAIQAQQEAQRQGAAALEKGAAAYDPYSQFGLESTNRLAALMGLRPGEGAGSLMRQPTAAELEMDPGYAFREQQGMQAINRSAAANAGLQSGAALKAAQRFGQDLASQEYGNAYNRFMANRANVMGLLQGGVNTGFGAAQGKGQLAGQTANLYSGTGANLANTMLANPYGQAAENIGQARASGYMGGASALSQALGGLGENAMAAALYNRRYGQPDAASYAGYTYGAPTSMSAGYTPGFMGAPTLR